MFVIALQLLLFANLLSPLFYLILLPLAFILILFVNFTSLLSFVCITSLHLSSTFFPSPHLFSSLSFISTLPILSISYHTSPLYLTYTHTHTQWVYQVAEPAPKILQSTAVADTGLFPLLLRRRPKQAEQCWTKYLGSLYLLFLLFLLYLLYLLFLHFNNSKLTVLKED